MAAVNNGSSHILHSPKQDAMFIEPLVVRRKLYSNLSSTRETLSSLFKHIYNMPQAALHPITTFISIYAVQYYSFLGASYSYLILGLAIGRAIDIVFTPLMASATDTFRSYYGRRRPFIFVGIWVYCLMIILLFVPPTTYTGAQKATWFCLTYIGVALSHTLLAVPYDSLGMELADTYDERASLWWIGNLYSNAGSFVLFFTCAALPGIVRYSGTPYVCSSETCYSSTGTGSSCLPYYTPGQSSEGSYARYSIFNATHWSDSNPVAISALWSASPIQALQKYGSCRMIGSTIYSTPESLFNQAACASSYEGGSQSLTSSGCIAAYCQCLLSCKTLCNYKNMYWAFLYAMLIFSFWMVWTMCAVVYSSKERAMLKGSFGLPATPGMAAGIFITLKNKAFTALLLPWALDCIVYLMVAYMLTYYVRHKVRPDTHTWATKGVECNGGLGRFDKSGNVFETSYMCRGDTVTGFLLAALSLSSFVSSFVWRLIVQRAGKKLSWIWSSVLTALTLAGLAGASSGSVAAILGVTCAVGAAFGGNWIVDAILNDAIDYEEFISGHRIEATYSMYRSLLPKLASIFAIVFPVASLWSMGYISPIAGVEQKQPARVESYILFLSCIVPAIISLISAWLKLGYPLRTREAVSLVCEGIGMHMQHREALDPLTCRDYARDIMTAQDLRQALLLENFPATIDATDLRATTAVKHPHSTITHFVSISRDIAAMFLIAMTGCVVAIALTFQYFPIPSLAAVPYLFFLLLGISLLGMTITTARLQAAIDLKKESNRPNLYLLDRIILARRFTDELASSELVQVLQESHARRTLRMLRQRAPKVAPAGGTSDASMLDDSLHPTGALAHKHEVGLSHHIIPHDDADGYRDTAKFFLDGESVDGRLLVEQWRSVIHGVKPSKNPFPDDPSEEKDEQVESSMFAPPCGVDWAEGDAEGTAWELELMCFLKEQRDINNGVRAPYRTTAVNNSVGSTDRHLTASDELPPAGSSSEGVEATEGIGEGYGVSTVRPALKTEE